MLLFADMKLSNASLCSYESLKYFSKNLNTHTLLSELFAKVLFALKSIFQEENGGRFSKQFWKSSKSKKVNQLFGWLCFDRSALLKARIKDLVAAPF